MWRRLRLYAVVVMAAATTLLTSYIKDSFLRRGKSYRRPAMTSTLFGANHKDREDVMYDFLENFQPKLDPNWELQYESYTRDRDFMPSTCPYGLVHRKNKSRWFESRYIDDIKMFMDKEDIKDESFKKLQAKYLLPFGYKDKNRTAVEEIFSVLPHPPVVREGRKKCVRCAVVGTGGQLKGSRRGKEIDSHDYVFRLNHALVGSLYVRDVGNKTSFYIFFPESGHVQHVIKSDPILVYIPFKDWDLAWMAGWLIRKKVPPPQCWIDKEPDCRKYGYPGEPKLVRPERLRLAHPDFLRYVFCNYLNATGQRPTTGVFTAFMAVHMCDQVSLYGFGFDPRYPMHYYDQDIFTEPRENDTAHNFGNERALWRILDRENIVRWVRR
ncbi:CMP-N-acetylneuraminate-beta-galactosamide-alpha-2,3-sialyltransferase 1-like [Branchiostoma floridae]|uniref:alpha-N-acetylgalactosaminide alpha-2,6-sialyltransferase n=1 Tax=Branchiostoma floridae TaxID=7739 RepID=A0A9J7MJD9_BRAFL|nr:CMP-N-acetylneuraminate-beta-galactosamide-alpha-2,3-sialyltransferase 1-like [Branchiostoma floridae]